MSAGTEGPIDRRLVGPDPDPVGTELGADPDRWTTAGSTPGSVSTSQAQQVGCSAAEVDDPRPAASATAALDAHRSWTRRTGEMVADLHSSPVPLAYCSGAAGHSSWAAHGSTTRPMCRAFARDPRCPRIRILAMVVDFTTIPAENTSRAVCLTTTLPNTGESARNTGHARGCARSWTARNLSTDTCV